MPSPYRPPAAAMESLPVTQDDLEFIRNTDLAARSRYQSVYPSKKGWQARAFKKRIGRVQASEREAARVVVRWWKHHFGHLWRHYFAHRQTPGWVLLPAPGGGWHPVVSVVVRTQSGRAVSVRERTEVWPVVYGDKKVAAAAVRNEAESRYGCMTPLVVRRGWTPSHRVDRRTPVPSR